MKKDIFIFSILLIIFSLTGCNAEQNTTSFEDLSNSEIKDETEVNIEGKTAYFYEVNEEEWKENGETEFEITGPTQMLALVNENSKTIYVYNELDVTGKEVEKDEEVIIKGEYYDKGEEAVPIVRATEIN